MKIQTHFIIHIVRLSTEVISSEVNKINNVVIEVPIKIATSTIFMLHLRSCSSINFYRSLEDVLSFNKLSFFCATDFPEVCSASGQRKK